MTPIPPWALRESPVPRSLDDLHDPDVRTFLAVHAIALAEHRDTWGWDDLVDPPEHQVHKIAHDSYNRRVLLVAEPADATPGSGEVLGYALADLPLADNLHLSEAELCVAHAHRRRGLGSALLDALLARLHAEGRTHVIIGSEHRGEPEPHAPNALEAPTGVGRVDANDPGAAFLRARGFSLAQAMRYSVLPLPRPAVDLVAARAEAERVSTSEYEVLTWHDHAPEEHVEEYAAMLGAMSTDAPLGDVALTPEVWDVARVREVETRSAEVRTCLTAAALHVASGHLAGFTTMQFPTERPDIVFQHDTLVRREHRGHRLGMLLKAVNLETLAASVSGTGRVHTWNAAENDHMLEINVALGFETVGIFGEWQHVG